MTITKNEITAWLKETNESKLDELWHRADKVRHENVGDEVHLRGLVEISNYCVRKCGYCGIRVENRSIQRYRMSADEIISCVNDAKNFGYGTVVMQAGEDFGLTANFIAGVIRRIKAETGLAITLSLGERTEEELVLWREAGADRYLLRFETSDSALYEHIHPSLPNKKSNRFEHLRMLDRIGYEVGTGVMVGIPGQTFDTLANDILLFREFDIDMIGVGPYIPHPETPLWQESDGLSLPTNRNQVPNTELMTYKVVALTRLVCPETNIPSTTALATLNTESGRELGLQRGANIVMPNITPTEYREKYEIYPGKACLSETASQCNFCMTGRIISIGRKVGRGPGSRRKKSVD